MGLLIIAVTAIVFYSLNSLPRDRLIRLNGQEVYIATPYSFVNFKERNVVMAIHGNGREARNYFIGDKKGSKFYDHQRDLAVKSGAVFVVVSNGKYTWGTDRGLTSLLKVYNYVQKKYRVKKAWTLWGTSAGGTLANRMVIEHPDLVKNVIGTYPVFDLEDMFSRHPAAQVVWKEADRARAANPALHPDKLAQKRYLIFHGDRDKVVPAEKHSVLLRDTVNRMGGEVKLYIFKGGHYPYKTTRFWDREITDFIRNPSK